MKNTILLLFILLTSIGAFAQDQHYYEEYKDGNLKNALDPRYKNLRKIYDTYTTEQKAALEKMGLMDFKKDNALLPYPRIFSESEIELLQKGVAQRGFAIRAFLQDYYSGKNTFLEAGVIPKQVLDRIVLRHGEGDWKKFIKPKHLNFWYGPDIIRGPPDPKNPKLPNFKIVEDNTDFIGGIGDLILAKQSLEKNIPEYNKYINSADPKKFYDALAAEYLKRAKKYNGIPVMTMYTHELAVDNEDLRLKKIFEDRGIKVVEIDTYTNNTKRIPRLETDEDGVWLIEKYGQKTKKSKVGYIIGNMRPVDLEFSHPANRRKRILNAAQDAVQDKQYTRRAPKRTAKLKKLLRPNRKGEINLDALEKFMIDEWPVSYRLEHPTLGVRGLLDSVFSGKVGLTNSPGLQFINDKEFYMYIPKLIEHYLHQKPIIQNIQTESFAEFTKDGKVLFRKKTSDKVFKGIDHWVIKGVDGSGGDAVWVGPKMDKSYIPELKLRIAKDPPRHIFQRYTPLSILDGHIIDTRLHADISAEGKIIVAKVPLGRAILKTGDGKVNLSLEGKEVTNTIQFKKNTTPCQMNKVYIANARKLLEEF